jgi:D-alanyl-D-alanine carboxypeptidase
MLLITPAHALVPQEALSSSGSALDEAAAAYLASPDASSAVYVAVYNRKTGLQMKAFGESAPGVPATVNDHFLIGSITKTVFATAVLQHVEKGVLSLDDTVRQVAPNVAKKFPKAAGYTIRQLLSMDTRIGDYADTAVADMFKNPARVFSRDELITMGFAATPKPKEGGYSTTNYIILGNVMQEITGRTPASLVNDVLRQAGMKHSRLTVMGARPTPVTHGFIGEEYGSIANEANPSLNSSSDVTDWPITWGREGGGAYATLPDLYTWAKLCEGNALLSPEMVAQRGKTHRIDAGDYGLGIIRQGAYWGHTGQAIGYEALVACNPKTGNVVALAVNNTSSLSTAMMGIGQAVFPEYVMAALKS